MLQRTIRPAAAAATAFSRAFKAQKPTTRLLSTVPASQNDHAMREADFKVDHLVIGAGVVGLAVAERLAARGGSTLIVDKNPAVGQETRMLYDVCSKNKIEHSRVTKWVVGHSDQDTEYLSRLMHKGHQLGVTQLALISQDQMRKHEPHVAGTVALVSPTTGIVDVHGFMDYLAQSILGHGSDVALECKVTHIEHLGSSTSSSPPAAAASSPPSPSSIPESEDGPLAGPFRVTMETPAGVTVVEAATLINCGGLHSDKIYNMVYHGFGFEQDDAMRARCPYRVYYCKGHYYSYKGPTLVSRLIYPVPDPNITSLGTHLTLDLAGRMRFGPDVLYVDRSDDYAIDLETLASPEHLQMVSRVIQSYLPAIQPDHIYPDYAGIRPKVQAPGDPFKDFVIERRGGYVHLAGIESPGLTSSLAIAEHVEALLF
ncbi:hypothetical protein DFQ27_003801 [Actinomortierella ambigua]|uniref:L-2-hydroxyglutarate dehydrogenase, mitochondrial n=1 Tax=Actinomortierella ambigua TaxID=1343610 RepID=A0A9P6Q5P4_9FUNG|nr:hypothetical protein DFQ27_003801 [Actinomortierella ambigua]